MNAKFFESHAEGQSHFYATEAEAEASIQSLRECSDEYAEVEFEDIFREVDAHDIDTNCLDDTSDETAALIAEARGVYDELNSIMTTSEVEEEFALSQGTARSAALYNSIPARKSSGTWLIRRADAVARWGKRVSKSASLTLLAVSLALVITRMM